MENILVHIGYHKTGSTWLQRELFVSGNGVFEPLSDRSEGHSSVANHLILSDTSALLSSFELNTEKVRYEAERLFKQTDRYKGKIPVISHERLSGNPHSSGFDGSIIADRVKAAFPDARILIVIREQRSFILSNYFQYLSIGGTHGLCKYLSLGYDGRRPGFSGGHIDYLPLVKGYFQRFGRENVCVVPYEIFKQDPTEFIHILSSFVGVDIPVDLHRFKVRRNKKESQFVNYHLRKLNLLLKGSSVNDYSTLSNRVSRAIANGLLSAVRRLSPESLDHKLIGDMEKQIEQWCGSRYAESNTQLQQLLGVNIEGLGYRVSKPTV